MLDPNRVLRIIEGMVLENEALVTPPKDQTADDRLINDIYLVAHTASATCKNPHEDWAERTLKIEKTLVDHGIIPSWPDHEE